MWPSVNFGEVVQISRGISYSSSELTDEGMGRPLVNLRNVEKGGGFRINGLKYYTGDMKERHRVLPGDLLIANTDLSKAKDVLGSPILVPMGFGYEDAVFSLDLTKLVVNKNLAMTKYVAYFLESPDSRIFMKANGSGTTVMHLQLKALPSLKMPLPPLEEQRRLVEILEDQFSRLDAALADVKKGKAKATQLRSALLNEAFVGESSSTWRSLPVRELGKWITGSTPSSKNKDFIGNEVPFVTPGDVAAGGEIRTIARRISRKGADTIRVINPPSIQLVCIGATLGKVGLSESVVTTNQQINSLEPDTSIVLPKFAMWLLASAKYQSDLWSASSSTTVPILNKGNLEKISVLLPNVSDQEKILQTLELNLSQLAQILNTLDALKNQLGNFRRSLLQAAFTGRLTRKATHV